jgi:hypothetical protein
MVLPGFNTDFKHKGQVFHAQTEDNGVNNPVVVTLLYLKGAILASKKSSYADLLEKENYQQQLMDLMKDQHRSIMREVLAGKYEDTPGTPDRVPEDKAAVEAAPEAPPLKEALAADSLDRQIMEYLESFAEQKRGSRGY